MPTEETIALECPCCRAPIYRPLTWFKQTYATCPECGGGVSATQFEAQVRELEEAFDASIEEMVKGTKGHGCCGGKGH